MKTLMYAASIALAALLATPAAAATNAEIELAMADFAKQANQLNKEIAEHKKEHLQDCGGCPDCDHDGCPKCDGGDCPACDRPKCSGEACGTSCKGGKQGKDTSRA